MQTRYSNNEYMKGFMHVYLKEISKVIEAPFPFFM